MDSHFIIFLVGFFIICLASKQIGELFRTIKLPLISGFLFTGILAGPFVLGLIPAESIESLRFIDELSLSIIAFVAGSELYMKDLRNRIKSIAWITLCMVILTFTFCCLSIFFLSGYIPFMKDMIVSHRIAVSLLGGTIMIARAPSSAIAVIKEMRAKGPFTQTALGVTMIMDVVVITLFSLNSSIAEPLISNVSMNLSFLGVLLLVLLLSILSGLVVGKFLDWLTGFSWIPYYIKIFLILLIGYGTFLGVHHLKDISLHYLGIKIVLEPLLICMMAGFFMTNFSPSRNKFTHLLHEISPIIYILFFTLTGASLALNILGAIWPITLALFFARLLGIFMGSFLGGTIAKEPFRFNSISGLAYITQAGVGLGLAKEVATHFSGWGNQFATLIISVIVVNEIIGPPCFKWALGYVKESHPRAKKSDFGLMHNAIIFGSGSQTIALAHQLYAHDWKVKIVCKKNSTMMVSSYVSIYSVDDFTFSEMEKLDAREAGAIVTMLSDEDNYEICELFREHYENANMIVLMRGNTYLELLHGFGALIVTPTTAIVSLLDHFVRTPSAASLLLGMEKNHDVVDLEVQNPNLFGMCIRELLLPMDVLIMAVHRKEQSLSVHGQFSFQKGDIVTMVGTFKSLEELTLRFEF